MKDFVFPRIIITQNDKESDANFEYFSIIIFQIEFLSLNNLHKDE